MSKRKPMDKAQARERRDRLLETAAAAQLSLTEGVREMRAISGMTQEEFARHREVSARVIKAVELGQGNPTVATLNRIGEFFGLEVGFVPIKKTPSSAVQPQPAEDLKAMADWLAANSPPEATARRLGKALSEVTLEGVEWEIQAARNDIHRLMYESISKLDSALFLLSNHDLEQKPPSDDAGATEQAASQKRKPRSS
jgi:transcriptional regulator with XRE-family HTH domain